MTKITEILAHIEALHQLPESHPISQREKISLAHIDVRGELRANRERFEADRAKSRKENAAAAANFEIGQSVVTKQGFAGTIVSFDGNNIVIEGNGITKKFSPTFVRAS